MVTPALVWPGFVAAEHAREARVRRRLAKAAETPLAAESPVNMVSALLGLPPVPEAALVRLAEGRDAAADGYLAEPVMLGPDRDRLLLRRLGGDALEAVEVEALVAAAHEHFGANELRIEPAAEGPWHVRLPGQAALPGMALAQAAALPVEASPEQFGVGIAGMRLLNELQMLWHAHPVNEARRAAGRLQANALWVWGGGELPPAPPVTGLRALAGEAPSLAGLAQWLGLPLMSPEAALEERDARGLVVAITAGEEDLGGRWLRRLAARRSGFELLGAGRRWQAGPRRLGWRW